MRLRIFLSAVLLLLCFDARVMADKPAVGDKPDLQFTAVNGDVINLARLHGKLVVIDFWATWCGPCMHEAPHMVELNKKYADQGLQLIGVSLDQDKAKMTQVAQQSGFVWPQYFDGLAWQTKLAVAWGIKSIPQTFLISPDGVVLWEGHPAMIDQPLADAFKNSPPRLVDPAVLTAANKQLDDVAAALKTGDAVHAMKLMAVLPDDAKKDGALADRAHSISADLHAAGEQLLADVETMITGKQYGAAVARLGELIKALPCSAVATKAHARLDDLMKSPVAKAGLEAEKHNAAAEAELEMAQKLQAAKKDEPAYLKYKSVAKLFAGTPAGDTATAAVAEYEKDPTFVKRVTDSAGSAKAKAALSMAASYVQSGRTDLAKKKYQDVIDQFPGTAYADTAKAELAKLN